MTILIGTNVVALVLLIGFDRLGIFEKSGDTYRAKKKLIRNKVFGRG